MPLVTLGLIAANTVIFLLELSSGNEYMRVIATFGLIPHRAISAFLTSPFDVIGWLPPFVTSIFLHGGWIHFIGNMWFLWIFGDNVEDRMGRLRFLGFYLGCGVVASVTQVLFDVTSQVPVIGASGAVAGVLGAYLLLFPRAKILTLLPIFFFITFVRIPAVYFLGFWFLKQIWWGSLTLSAMGGRATDVAWWAHAGGFVVGFITAVAFRKRRVESGRPPDGSTTAP